MIDISEKMLSGKSQKWIALLFGILGFVTGNFYHDTLTTTELWFNPVWFLHDEDKYLFSIPGLTHGVIAIAMLAPLYIRKILKYRNISIISLVLLVSNLYLFSTWVQVAMGFQKNFTNKIVTMGLISAIMLSWLGMRSISGFCWLIVVLLCVYNMVNGAEMLGAWGIIFLICSIVSIWFQTKMPLDEYFSALKGEFVTASHSTLAESMRENIQTSTSNAKNFAQKETGKI